jgi:hypothetical protein
MSQEKTFKTTNQPLGFMPPLRLKKPLSTAIFCKFCSLKQVFCHLGKLLIQGINTPNSFIVNINTKENHYICFEISKL